MVGGDRRSPPRHKAKGGGGRGKGGGGNDELGSGGKTLEQSDLTKSSTREDFFRFGGAAPLHSVDGKISATVGACIAVESPNLHKESTGSCVKFGKKTPVQILLQETDSLQNEIPCGTKGVAVGSSEEVSRVQGARSWALEVEAQEDLEKRMNSKLGVAKIVAGFEQGCKSPSWLRQQGSNHPNSPPFHASAVDVALESLVSEVQHTQGTLCCVVSDMQNSCAVDMCMAGDDSVQQGGNGVDDEDTIMDDKLGHFSCAQGVCRIPNSDGRRPVSMRTASNEANSLSSSDSLKLQENRDCPNTVFEANHLENKGITHGKSCSLGDLQNNLNCMQGGVNTYVKTGLIGEKNSAPSSSFPPHVNKQTPKPNAAPAMPNPWKRPAHVKIDLHKLGNISMDGTSVAFDEESYDRNIERLERGLIGKLIGRKLPLHILDQELTRRWSHVGGFRTVLMKGDCFMCIFETVEARDSILMGGPWQIMGHIIGLDRWSPNFNPDFLTGLSSPVWIRLPGLPFPFWDNKTIARIAAMIGDPLWIDAQTVDWGRSEYARVCVRLNLSTKLPTGVWIQGKLDKFRQPVEYEGISLLCFHCGIIGHKMDSCRQYKASTHKEVNRNKMKNQNATPEPTFVTGEGSHSTQAKEPEGPSSRRCEMPQVMNSDKQPDKDDECYGPWILVSRKRKLQPPRGRTSIPSRATRPATAKETQVMENVHTATVQTTIAEPNATTQTAEFVENAVVSSPPLATTDQPVMANTASPTNPDSSMQDSMAIVPRQPQNRCGKDRISKAHFEKELLQLGPIALKSRKRKKTVRIAGMEQSIKVLTHDTYSSDASGGGDASPSMGK